MTDTVIMDEQRVCTFATSLPLQRATCQQLADYFNKQSMMGRGQWTARLDRRGMGYLHEEHQEVNLVPPIEGEQIDFANNTVFLSARF